MTLVLASTWVKVLLHDVFALKESLALNKELCKNKNILVIIRPFCATLVPHCQTGSEVAELRWRVLPPQFAVRPCILYILNIYIWYIPQGDVRGAD